MKLTLSILFILVMNLPVQSQNKKAPEASLYYLVRQPKINNVNPPLLILLHGIGSNERDLFALAGQLPGNFLIVSARAPYSMGPDSYAWYHADFSTGKPIYDVEQEEKSRIKLIGFIDELKHQLSFDDKQVYLCGFSQGAIMSYSVGLTNPEKVKGIAIMSGRLLEEIKPMVASKAKLKQLQIFISHGNQDKTLDIQYARSAMEYLKSLGIDPTYKEYTAGHEINGEMISDLFNWLSEKSRGN